MPSARAAVVGAFVLGGLGIVIAAVLFFYGTHFLAPKTRAVVYFEGSVGGLAQGAPVTFRGVRVGSVASVAVVIDPAIGEARIPVHLRLEPDRVELVSSTSSEDVLRRLIHAGLVARLEPESLVTGQMDVQLDLEPGTKAHALYNNEPGVAEIPSVPSDLQELREQLTHAPIADTIVQAKQTLASVERLADHLDGVIGPLAMGVQHLLGTSERTLDTASEAIGNLQRDGSATLKDFQQLANAGRTQLDARGRDVGQTLAVAGKTLRDADTLVLSANGVLAPGAPPRDDLEAMLRDLSASASTLRSLSAAIDRDPTIVLRGRRAP
jgi:paraquat-inducible protein B